MAVKSNFTVSAELDAPAVLRRLLVQIVNKLDVVIAKQEGNLLPDTATLQDVIGAINEIRK